MANDFGRVTADPEVLRGAAEEASSRIAAYRSSVGAVARLVDSSSGFWKGEAAEAYRSVFANELAKAYQALDEFAQYPVDLLSYAGVYSEAISQAQSIVQEIAEFDAQML